MKKLTGVELIAQERQEQIEKHGHSVASDVKENAHNELLFGAIALIHFNVKEMPGAWITNTINKMLSKPFKERLVVAGAFIAAEIDRLEELENQQTTKNHEYDLEIPFVD